MKDFPFMAAMIGIAVYASTANSRTAGATSSTVNAGDAAGGTVSYCPSSGASTAYEYIQLIDFGGIDYVSGNNNGYGDFHFCQRRCYSRPNVFDTRESGIHRRCAERSMDCIHRL
jgi:hypothetical protein